MSARFHLFINQNSEPIPAVLVSKLPIQQLNEVTARSDWSLYTLPKVKEPAERVCRP